MRSRNIVIPLLVLGIAAAQRDWNVRAAANPDRVAMSANMPANSDDARGGNPLWVVPFAELHVTRERPLFSVSRRPPSPPAVAVVTPPPPPPAPPPPASRPPLVLLGTVIGGSPGIGVFLEEANNKAKRLVVGESYDGWVLRAVTSTEAFFDNAGRSTALKLRPASQLAMKGSVPASGDELMPIVRHRKR